MPTPIDDNMIINEDDTHHQNLNQRVTKDAGFPILRFSFKEYNLESNNNTMGCHSNANP